MCWVKVHVLWMEKVVWFTGALVRHGNMGTLWEGVRLEVEGWGCYPQLKSVILCNTNQWERGRAELEHHIPSPLICHLHRCYLNLTVLSSSKRSQWPGHSNRSIHWNVNNSSHFFTKNGPGPTAEPTSGSQPGAGAGVTWWVIAVNAALVETAEQREKPIFQTSAAASEADAWCQIGSLMSSYRLSSDVTTQHSSHNGRARSLSELFKEKADRKSLYVWILFSWHVSDQVPLLTAFLDENKHGVYIPASCKAVWSPRLMADIF